MVTKKLLLVFFIFASFQQAIAQIPDLSWRKHQKLAAALKEQGKWEEAGEHYFKAWKKKQKKHELAFQAGECFYAVKNYKKAIEAYKYVKEMNQKYDKVGFHYARALKQNQQYSEANREFTYFMNNYAGKDASQINQIVQNEMRGCEMAMKATYEINDKNEALKIIHLGGNINTDAIEFAPIPFGEDVLYYSSTVDGSAKIYRSQKLNGEWTRPSSPKDIAANISKAHFANGSFTPDGKRFYFTQCDGNAQGGFSRCEIFVMKVDKNGKWKAPERLPDYINEATSTSTHPTIQFADDKEILYFASDRSSGKGGFDIWYSEKHISDDLDFTFPKNLGTKINTPGDELSPFYKVSERTLYFSSNGHVGYGGLDIFKSSGSADTWTPIENMNAPYNSSSDDWFFTKQEDNNGYFSSNRLFGAEKITTTHEDIFRFYTPQIDLIAQGQVFDNINKDRPLRDINVKLYEIVASGQKRLLHSKAFTSGKYEISLLPEKDYRLEISKDGYQNQIIQFSTANDDGKTTFNEDAFLEKIVLADTKVVSNQAMSQLNPASAVSSSSNVIVPSGVDNAPSTTTSAPVRENKVPPVEPTIIHTSPIAYEPSRPASSVPTARSNSGEYYTVQLEAAVNFNKNKFQSLSDLGQIEKEFIPEKNWWRAMITSFNSESEARDVLNSVKRRGFERAFIAKYRDGKRIGIIK